MDTFGNFTVGHALDGQIYYVKVCKRNHFNGDNKAMLVSSYTQTAAALRGKYPGMKSYLLFVEENEIKNFGSIPKENLITGRAFFRKFFNMSISEYYSLIEEGQKIVRVEQQYKRMRKTINKFAEYATEYGDDAAYNLLTSPAKSNSSMRINL